MEVIRDTDGSYVFAFTRGEDCGEAEPLCWEKLTAYFMSHIEAYEHSLAVSLGSQPGAPAPEYFTLLEDFCGSTGELLGYWALRKSRVESPALVLDPVAIPKVDIDLPECELPGIPLPFEAAHDVDRQPFGAAL